MRKNISNLFVFLRYYYWAILDEDITNVKESNVILHMTQYEASPLSPLQRARGVNSETPGLLADVSADIIRCIAMLGECRCSAKLRAC